MTSERTSRAQGIDMDSLQESGNCLYVLDADLVITYVNPVYLKFAEENGGIDVPTRWAVGCKVLDAISGPLREFYEEFFRTCMENKQVTNHDYECSSADEYRLFRMHVFPLGEDQGLLLDHSLVTSKKHDRPPHNFDQALYTDAHGIVHQCGHCRRVQNLKTSAWDWCPDTLGRLKISHGLCPSCLDHYYPDQGTAPGA